MDTENSIKPGDTLTPSDAAQILKVCHHTLRRLELRGILKALRPFGRRKIFMRRDVEALLQGGVAQ